MGPVLRIKLFALLSFFLQVDGDLSVNKLMFLSREYLMHKSSAHLVSSGPYGMIHFWSVFNGNQLYARFKIVSSTSSLRLLWSNRSNSPDKLMQCRATGVVPTYCKCLSIRNSRIYLQPIITATFTIGTLPVMHRGARNVIRQHVC
jgi:hypothetical protein